MHIGMYREVDCVNNHHTAEDLLNRFSIRFEPEVAKLSTPLDTRPKALAHAKPHAEAMV